MDEAGSPAWPGTDTLSTRIGKTLSPTPDDDRVTFPAARPAPFRAPVKPAPSPGTLVQPEAEPCFLACQRVNAGTVATRAPNDASPLRSTRKTLPEGNP